jgi:hypothetical protein
MVKTNGLFYFFCVSITIVLFVLLYQNQHEYNVPLVSWAKTKLTPSNNHPKIVRSNILLDIGERMNVGIKMAIPCETNEQKDKLFRSLKQIKHEFLMNQDQGNLERLVRARDFDGIKKGLLQVVNNYSDRPIKTLYFEEFLAE